MKYVGSSPEERRERKKRVESNDKQYRQYHKGKTTEAKIKALSVLKKTTVSSQCT